MLHGNAGGPGKLKQFDGTDLVTGGAKSEPSYRNVSRNFFGIDTDLTMQAVLLFQKDTHAGVQVDY